MKRIIILLIALGISIYFLWPEPKFKYGHGQVAPDPPQQKRLHNASPTRFDDYVVRPLANFSIKARVLSKHRYYFGHESRVSPLDVVLGWGPMSDERVLENISISQHNRWYYWRSKELPISESKIKNHSANMHLIPANSSIRKKMKKIKVGHVVDLKGALVKVEATDGWSWKSSLSRTDRGDGACELIWVEKLDLLVPDRRR